MKRKARLPMILRARWLANRRLTVLEIQGRIFRAGLLWAGVMLAGMAAPVGAIDVVETVDYPFSSGFGPGSVSAGVLEPGGNTIAGTLAGFCEVGDCNTGTGDTQDSFRITVPSGYKIQSLTVTTSNVSGPAGFSVTVNLRSPVADRIPVTFVVLNGTTGNLVSSPIEAGEYSFSIFGQSASQEGSYSLNWLIAIQLVQDNGIFSDGFESGDTSRWASAGG